MQLLKKKSSKDVAKNRLKLLLIHDRANCSPEILDSIKRDIIDVLAKYMQIDIDNMDIQIGSTKSDRKGDTKIPALYANIPILNMRKQK